MFTREIGADDLPVFTAIGGFEKHVGGSVENSRIQGRKQDRLSAIRAVFAGADGYRDRGG